MRLLLIVLTLLLCGCDSPRILSPASVGRIGMDIANLKAANHAEVPQSEHVRSSTNKIADDMAIAMGIDIVDLPKYETVSKEQWIKNAKEADKQVTDSVSKPLTPSDGWLAAAGGGLSIAIIIALRLVSVYASSTPVGQLAGVLMHLCGLAENPKERSISNKVEVALDEAQKVDPHGPVFTNLSSTMTRSEKDYVRNKKIRRKANVKV